MHQTTWDSAFTFGKQVAATQFEYAIIHDLHLTFYIEKTPAQVVIGSGGKIISKQNFLVIF